MKPLIDFITKHVELLPGEDLHAENSEEANLIFFRVRAKDAPSSETLRTLIAEHEGEFCDCTPLDKKEHGYIELGAWLGSQEHALVLMGLGSLLGLWKLLTPLTVLKEANLPDDLVRVMAGTGLVTVQAE